MRSAKIFFPITQPQEQIKEIESPEYQILMKSVGMLLGQQMKRKLSSIECLHNFIIQIRDRQGEVFRQLVRDTEGKLSKLLVELDWGKIEHLLSITSFLAILNDEIDWQDKLNSCFDQE